MVPREGVRKARIDQYRPALLLLRAGTAPRHLVGSFEIHTYIYAVIQGIVPAGGNIIMEWIRFFPLFIGFLTGLFNAYLFRHKLQPAYLTDLQTQPE